jgi:hypothetical protein
VPPTLLRSESPNLEEDATLGLGMFGVESNGLLGLGLGDRVSVSYLLDEELALGWVNE